MSWKDKLRESLVDRMVVGLLAAVLLVAVEYRFRILEQHSDSRAAVSTVVTAALVQQSTNLMTAVESYMLLIDKMVRNNSTSSPMLSGLEHKIRLAVRLFAAVSPDVCQDANELEQAMTNLSNFVRGDQQTEGSQTKLQALRRHRDHFLDRYVEFTAKMRTVTQQAVEVELGDGTEKIDSTETSNCENANKEEEGHTRNPSHN